MKYDYTCRNCEHEFTLRIDSAGVWEENCPRCDHEIDTDQEIEKTKQDPDSYYEDA